MRKDIFIYIFLISLIIGLVVGIIVISLKKCDDCASSPPAALSIPAAPPAPSIPAAPPAPSIPAAPPAPTAHTTHTTKKGLQYKDLQYKYSTYGIERPNMEQVCKGLTIDKCSPPACVIDSTDGYNVCKNACSRYTEKKDCKKYCAWDRLNDNCQNEAAVNCEDISADVCTDYKPRCSTVGDKCETANIGPWQNRQN